MNRRIVSASLALACLVTIGASIPAQAGDWGRLGYGHHHDGPLPVTGAGSANTSSMAMGSSSNLGLTPLIRCGLTGIRTSKLFHERRLRPALDDNPGGGGSSPSV